MKPVRQRQIVGLMLVFAFFTSVQVCRGESRVPREIAPDVPSSVLLALSERADLYFTGGGNKGVLVVTDVFCPYSRKAHDLLMRRMKYIGQIKVLLVTRFPDWGSDLVAAFVEEMHALGKGANALESAYNLEVPRVNNRAQTRRILLKKLEKAFSGEFNRIGTERIRSSIEEIEANTQLAESHDYTGTPHIIIGNRVLHGYSRRAVEILLVEKP